MGVKGLARYLKESGAGSYVNLTKLSLELAQKESVRQRDGVEEHSKPFAEGLCVADERGGDGLRIVVDGNALLFWLLQEGASFFLFSHLFRHSCLLVILVI